MSDGRLAGLVFAAAFLARIVAWMGLGMFGRDSVAFMTMADLMSDGRFHDALALRYHPGFPLLIAVGRVFTGSSPVSGYAVSLLLGAAAVVPLFYLIKDLFGRPAAFVTGLIYAFNSQVVSVQSDIMSDATFMFFFLSSLLLTWRTAEEPSLENGVVTGMAAAAAYLTRPEGALCVVLAAGWMAVELLRRRSLRGAGALTVTLVVVLILAAPFLFWVKSVRGKWAWSTRPSAASADRAVGIQDPKYAEMYTHIGGEPRLYRKYGASMLRLNAYGALFPWVIVGLAALGRCGWRKALFVSLAVLPYFGAVYYTLSKHNAMSDRYLMPPMTLVWGLAGLGMAEAIRRASLRWPEARWRPAAAGAFVVTFAIVPHLGLFAPRRWECRSYPLAAQWIRSQGDAPGPIPSLVPQVNYLAGSRDLQFPETRDELMARIRDERIRYLIYSERDVARRGALIAEIGALGLPGPVVQGGASEGTEKIYIQRVR